MVKVLSGNKNIKPIIILGAGRSGTKFLRDTLLYSEEVCAVPYDINYIWRYGNEKLTHDELNPDLITPKISQYIRNTILKLATKQKSDANVLLEKTVSNCLRVDFVNTIFPEAKFIHLIRDGRAVVESANRMWQTPPETRYLLKKLRYFPWKNYKYAFNYIENIVKGKYNSKGGLKVWGPRYQGIQKDIETIDLIEVCAIQWKNCVLKSLDSLALIPKSRVLTIKYEDFVLSSKCLEQVIEFIELENSQEIYKNFQLNIEKSNVNKWQNSMNASEIEILNNVLGE